MAKRYKKRKDGRYATNVTVGRDYVTGDPIKITVYGKSIEEIENNKALIKSDYLKGNNIITKNVKFLHYANQWLESKKPFLANKTYQMYDSAIHVYCKPLFSLDMKRIIRFDIQNLINMNLDKPRTCIKIHNTLHQIFEIALIDNIVNRNPCKGVQLPQYKSKTKRPLTHQEDVLSDVTTFTDRETAFILLVKWCGLRVEEVLALTVNDFNLAKRIVSIRNAVEFINNKPHMKKTKSDSGERDIPLLDECLSFISYYLTTLESPYLFTSIKSKQWISQQSFRKMWESIIKKMNKKADELNYSHPNGLTPYTFRHNYATMLDKADVPLKERQYLMGHANVTMTMNTYTHVDAAHLRATELLNNYVPKRLS